MQHDRGPAVTGQRTGAPVAVVDIGSNSVRLVAYEALSRALTPLFNEKVLCGLGRGVATTGLLAPEAMDKALAALRSFRVRCAQMNVADLTVLATAATRDARNGRAFLERARAAIGTDIALIDGSREAELSALGAVSGLYEADGIVGDLGGGSLELVGVRGESIGAGVSLPIGGLALSDLAKGSPKRAARIVRDALLGVPALERLRGRTFYAVGGTWRALARLHMARRGYPLNVAQGYVLPHDDPALFAELVDWAEKEGAVAATPVPAARRPLLGFGAVVLEELVRIGQPAVVMISTLGVREGMLFERLSPETRQADPLLAAARDFNAMRSRCPAHGEELCAWTDALVSSAGLPETAGERRLRHAACLLSDVAWRAHPDYRGAQAFTSIANAAFVGVDHPGRCFLALTINFRHEGLDAEGGAQLHALLSPGTLERARLLAAAMRVAFQLSAATAGVLPGAPLRAGQGVLRLEVPAALADLAALRVSGRLRQLARLMGREAEIAVEG